MMGCRANLALIHPRLFHSLVLIEPVIQNCHPAGPNAALFTSLRQEKWESRAKAEAQIRKNPLFKSMDPRILRAYLTYGLRDTEDGGVRLATPRAQEAWSYVRSNFQPLPGDTSTAEARSRERLLSPNLSPGSEPSMEVFMREESLHVYESLPHLRPRALFIYGASSHINVETMREKHISRTGTGRGGNGGVADGGVEMKIIDNASHLVVFEKPVEIARDISEWVGKEVVRWKEEKEFFATFESGKSKNDGKELSDKWIASVKKGASIPRSKAKDAAKL